MQIKVLGKQSVFSLFHLFSVCCDRDYFSAGGTTLLLVARCCRPLKNSINPGYVSLNNMPHC